MTWKSTRQCVAITAATTALAVAAILGSNPGTIAREMVAQRKMPHSRSPIVTYIPGQPLVVSIQHPYYDPTATVLYAEIDDMFGKPVGYLLPIAPTVAHPKKKGQIVAANRITVAFDTTTWYADEPKDLGALPPVIPAPAIGAGSTIIITTNVPTDIPPAEPIALETATLTL